jgi:glucosamine--fructose-6-phosphate aminotransferase (isomerizing)
MFREAAEAAEAVRRQRERNRDLLAALGERLRCDPPRALLTLARGSSDSAATFARYMVETRARTLTSSLSPSVASVYQAVPDLNGTVALAISQSGRSPDLITAAKQAKDQGAYVIAMVNADGSPLAAFADVEIPLSAGPERSVAASKSFVSSLAAILDLLAVWTGERRLQLAMAQLPDQLEQAWALDWSSALPILKQSSDMYVIGRGPGFAIAQEAALKLKETCAIHAEAFSGAELRHGPKALVRNGFPVLMFGQDDESRASMIELAADLAERGAAVISAGLPGAPGIRLPTTSADAVTAPILQIVSFYRLVNALAVALGRDPDRPPNLSKVTETL